MTDRTQCGRSGQALHRQQPQLSELLHLDAGTRPYAPCRSSRAIWGQFPQYRGREGAVDMLDVRINGSCMERSMNGRALPLTSREMLAMLAYMRWLSTGIPAGATLMGVPEPFLRVAVNGRLTVTDSGTKLGACLAGFGVAQVIDLGLDDHLNSGALINLFPDWSDERFALYVYYPSRNHVPGEGENVHRFHRRIARKPRKLTTTPTRKSRTSVAA